MIHDTDAASAWRRIEHETVVNAGGEKRTLYSSGSPRRSHNDEAVIMENGNVLAMVERKKHYVVGSEPEGSADKLTVCRRTSSWPRASTLLW